MSTIPSSAVAVLPSTDAAPLTRPNWYRYVTIGLNLIASGASGFLVFIYLKERKGYMSQKLLIIYAILASLHILISMTTLSGFLAGCLNRIRLVKLNYYVTIFQVFLVGGTEGLSLLMTYLYRVDIVQACTTSTLSKNPTFTSTYAQTYCDEDVFKGDVHLCIEILVVAFLSAILLTVCARGYLLRLHNFLNPSLQQPNQPIIQYVYPLEAYPYNYNNQNPDNEQFEEEDGKEESLPDYHPRSVYMMTNAQRYYAREEQEKGRRNVQGEGRGGYLIEEGGERKWVKF